MKKVCLVVMALLTAGSAWGFDAGSSCVTCHSNRSKLKELGAEGMYLDPAQVDREVGMKGKPTCEDCHLGNPTAGEKTDAHKGMLAPFLVAVGKNHKGEAISRAAAGDLQPLVPKGTGMNSMIPKGDPQKLDAVGIKKIIGIQWHDHDPETMAYFPKVAEQTCGRCHAKEVKDYNHSAKGLKKYQRAFRSWSEKQPGPQNCGMWPGQNEEGLRNQTAVPYTKAMNNTMNVPAICAMHPVMTVTLNRWPAREPTPSASLTPQAATAAAGPASAMPGQWTGGVARAMYGASMLFQIPCPKASMSKLVWSALTVTNR